MSTDFQQTSATSRNFGGFSLTPPVPIESRPGLKRNVGDDERLVSLVAGGVLAGAGLGTRGLLSLGLLGLGGSLIYRAVTGHCYMYDRMNLSSADTQQLGVRPGHGVRVIRTLHLNQSPEKVSKTWGELTNLPQIMRHLESVERLDGTRSHWKAKVMGMNFEWDAETTEFTPGKVIRFRSLPGGDVDCEGAVRFEDAPQGGTVLRVEMSYDPPAGATGDMVARLFGGNLEAQIEEDLRRFKQVLEGGQVPTVEGQPHG